LDGPACEYSNGDKEWMIEGKFHRLDGPAIERANGDKLWFKEGELHRLDGPAVELLAREESMKSALVPRWLRTLVSLLSIIQNLSSW
jgi:hypothetical protein